MVDGRAQWLCLGQSPRETAQMTEKWPSARRGHRHTRRYVGRNKNRLTARLCVAFRRCVNATEPHIAWKMDPYRPSPPYGAPTPPLILGNGTCALRLQRLELFPSSDSGTAQQSRPEHAIHKRKSLSTMAIDSHLAVPMELMTPISPNHIIREPTTTSARVPARAPIATAELLSSLRSRTLLDYSFMRDFGLAKRKPIEERNLSRMSAQSLYSVQMAKQELKNQARSLHFGRAPESEPPKSAKCEGSARPSAHASPPHSIDPLPPHRIQSSDTSSSYTPTLWKSEIMTQKYREQAPADKLSGAYSHASKNQHSSLAHARKTPRKNLVTNGPIIASDLSDFDLRKCHPRTVVTRHHGFLQQQDIQKLIDETGYDRTELYALWARFKALCSIAKSPKGIDKDTFCHCIPQLSVEDQFFIDRVFKILDADGSNILEWQEFVEALSALENGDVNKRADFLFRVYDLNGDGMIHRNEVMQFLLASLLVKPNDDLEEVAKHFVKKIFTSVGRQDSEVMRVEDAKKYMREHPSADIYSLFGRTMVTKRPKLDVNKWSRDGVERPSVISN